MTMRQGLILQWHENRQTEKENATCLPHLHLWESGAGDSFQSLPLFFSGAYPLFHVCKFLLVLPSLLI